MKTTQDAFFVVDSKNRPLAVLPEEELTRQQLLHRAVWLFLEDTQKRIVLQKINGHNAGKWGILAIKRIPATLAAEEFVLHCIPQGLHGHLKHLHCLPASPKTKNAFAEIFVLRDIQPAELHPQTQSLMASRQELSTMISLFPEQLTQAVHILWMQQLFFSI